MGKSTVANLLGGLLGCPVRHCGELVKAQARLRGVSPQQLSIKDHQEIDEQTRRIPAPATTSVIVEGLFLDNVFAQESKVIMVELTCASDERQKRFAQRSAGSDTDLVMRDKSDVKLLSALHTPESPRLQPTLTVDTSNISALHVAEVIAKWIGERQGR